MPTTMHQQYSGKAMRPSIRISAICGKSILPAWSMNMNTSARIFSTPVAVQPAMAGFRRAVKSLDGIGGISFRQGI